MQLGNALYADRKPAAKSGRFANLALATVAATLLVTSMSLEYDNAQQRAQNSKVAAAAPRQGAMLGQPAQGIDPEVAKLVDPRLMSIVFSDRTAAQEFYDEAVSNGERVCLSDLGTADTLRHEQRYWLRSC